MKTLKDYYRQSKNFEEYAENYFNYLHRLLKSTDKKELEGFLGILLAAKENGSLIFFLGNGGSATTAAHYVNDLCKFASSGKSKGFKVLNLTDNISWFTALANDEGYENSFCRQLDNFIKPGDVVVGISASGNSKNVIKAFKLANDKGAVTVAMVGFDGGEIKKLAKHCVHIKSDKGEYGPVEDIHMIIDHLISSYMAFLPERNK